MPCCWYPDEKLGHCVTRDAGLGGLWLDPAGFFLHYIPREKRDSKSQLILEALRFSAQASLGLGP